MLTSRDRQRSGRPQCQILGASISSVQARATREGAFGQVALSGSSTQDVEDDLSADMTFGGEVVSGRDLCEREGCSDRDGDLAFRQCIDDLLEGRVVAGFETGHQSTAVDGDFRVNQSDDSAGVLRDGGEDMELAARNQVEGGVEGSPAAWTTRSCQPRRSPRE